MNLETVSSAAMFLRESAALHYEYEALNHFELDITGVSSPFASLDLQFLHGIVDRILHRGVGTLLSLQIERNIASMYGTDFDLVEDPSLNGSIEWTISKGLIEAVNEFSDFADSWHGDSASITLDPENPDNERRLFDQLLDTFGTGLISFTYPQAYIADILPAAEAKNFLAQRVDFLLAFPNGRCLILEPGDHDPSRGDLVPADQPTLDKKRDAAHAKCGIPTLRFRNERIGTPELMNEVRDLLAHCEAERYLSRPPSGTNNTLQLSYLILLPTLISRIEHTLNCVLLQAEMWTKPVVRLCVVEQDLECAELALLSFLDRLRRLIDLYQINASRPQIQLVIIRNSSWACADLAPVQEKLQRYRCTVEVTTDPSAGVFDIVIDAAIKTNRHTPSLNVIGTCHATIRNTFPHSRLHYFNYPETPRRIVLNAEGEDLVTGFLGDFFRKTRLREGQLPIIRNVLAQQATIGLLPTSAGKSICYQMASLLTPGVTLVIDPIVFLMKDQVLSLTEQFGITKVVAWHSESGITQDSEIGELMATNLMIFVSPERFLRQKFRDAMQLLNTGGLFVNYAVLDEAHCVSMWGHDFRPAYLMLERCLREYCSTSQHHPVLVALTGTASQLVLIDLKRELHIDSFDAIVRPTKSFDRPELNYNVVRCRTDNKLQALQGVFRTIQQKLGVRNLHVDAWGVIFSHLPKQVWTLYAELVGNTGQHVAAVAKDAPTAALAFGVACGGLPNAAPVNASQWKEYKNHILPHFKRGKVHTLIGNSAIGVGIDNEYVSYAVAYCMPGSLEELGQQWGRAGRRGQTSECWLICSDDLPASTDQWLNGQGGRMPPRYDDLGTIAWYHGKSFPGEQADTNSTLEVMAKLFHATPDAGGRRPLHESGDERTQHYLSFLVMMGLAEDYAVTGMGSNATYLVKFHSNVELGILQGGNAVLKTHFERSLHAYLSRYRPMAFTEIRDGLAERMEAKLSQKVVAYLVHFIYDRIAYQRKESIRTIVTFCRDADQSPAMIRNRLKAFFDRNPKFSDRLDEMAAAPPLFASVDTVLQLIEGYDDAEHLYWETRRHLDERLRADWASINLYVAIFRERSLSAASITLFQQLMEDLRQQLPPDGQAAFLIGLLNHVSRLDQIHGVEVSEDVLPRIFNVLYLRYRLEYMSIVDGLDCNEAVKNQIRANVGAQQTREILDVVKRKHGLG